MPESPEGGFAQKAVVITLGGVSIVLVSFFAWLALTVVEIRVNVAEMKRDIGSLLETRRDNTSEQTRATGRRLDELERPEVVQ